MILLSLASFAQEVTVNQEEKIYKTVSGQELVVDMFSTSDSKQTSDYPAIAFFYGGGWIFGDRKEFYEACKRYARKGFITFSFQYLLSVHDDITYPNADITLVESAKDARSAIR